MDPATTSPPKTTATAHRTTRRRTLAAEPAPSSTKPTNKKHPKSSDSNIHSIIKPFSKLYSSHQNGAVSSKKDPILNPKTQIVEPSFRDKPNSADVFSKSPNYYLSKSQIETSFQAKPISVSEFQDKPMSKLSHRKTDSLSKSPNFLSKPRIETNFQAKPVSAPEIQYKPPNYLTNPQIETTFLAKPVSISAIHEKPFSKSSHQSRKTALEIEKEKLRTSITGSLEKSKKPHDFKIVSLSENKGELKKLAKKERGKEETIVSLSKSQDSGLKSDVKRPSFSLGVTGGRRRSFCNSQAQLADFFSCNGVKIVSVDMPHFMQIHAVDCARKTCDSLEKFTSKTLAFTLKKEFDGVYGPAWHCIVGSSFGSFVTHSVGGFMYFSIDHKIYILLFKTTVQKAPN